MKTLICPTCAKPHALFWRVGKGGEKDMAYRCDRQVHHKVETKYGTLDQSRYYTKIIILGPEQALEHASDDLPEELTHGRKEEIKLKDQGQFTLMYKKP